MAGLTRRPITLDDLLEKLETDTPRFVAQVRQVMALQVRLAAAEPPTEAIQPETGVLPFKRRQAKRKPR